MSVTIPAPIIVEPSQSFDGNDGPFSSFNISVGTPPQSLKVFISTSVYQTLVVLPLGCGAGTLPNCTALRGGEFSPGNSSTWQNNTANTSINIYPLGVDTQLGYNGNAELGFDVVSLPGSAGTTLKNQTVGGFAVTDFYLGLFGIDPESSNFLNSPPIPSYMQNLRNQSLIPSLSWGYTAGNQYRFDGKAFGSLTLGGYDKSRFVQHDGSWSIDAANDIAVQVESITSTVGSDSQGLLPTPIRASIDSSLPYIWLPIQACLLFENAFGLQWNDTLQLYLVNETLHQTLVQQNASLTFNLGGMTGGSSTSINITLPYAAFDLTASTPLATPATRYFPLKRAANSTQWVLGRTFFQEAFVVADYERKNFSVFPCQWEPDIDADIVSIISPTYGVTPVTEPSSSNSTSNPSGGSTNAGPIAGGIVGGIAGLAIIIALVYFFYWRPKRRQDYTTNGEKSEMFAPLPPNPALALDNPHLNNAELGNTQRISTVPELEGSPGAVFEMPVKETAASEMPAIDSTVQEMPTPETVSDITMGGFPWRASVVSEGGGQSPSPLGSPGSPGLQGKISSTSSPSPPPLTQPQPQRIVKPNLKTADSDTSIS